MCRFLSVLLLLLLTISPALSETDPVEADSSVSNQFDRLTNIGTIIISPSVWMSFGGWTDELSVNGMDVTTEIDNTEFDFNLVLGRMLEKKVFAGFDFSYYRDHSEATIDPDPTDTRMKTTLSQLYLGGVFRYYLFPTEQFIAYPEFSAGLMSNVDIERTTSDEPSLESESEWSARGFTYFIGAGASILVSESITVDIRGRYNPGVLTGDLAFDDDEDYSHTVRLSRFIVSLGISAYFSKP